MLSCPADSRLLEQKIFYLKSEDNSSKCAQISNFTETCLSLSITAIEILQNRRIPET